MLPLFLVEHTPILAFDYVRYFPCSTENPSICTSRPCPIAARRCRRRPPPGGLGGDCLAVHHERDRVAANADRQLHWSGCPAHWASESPRDPSSRLRRSPSSPRCVCGSGICRPVESRNRYSAACRYRGPGLRRTTRTQPDDWQAWSSSMWPSSCTVLPSLPRGRRESRRARRRVEARAHRDELESRSGFLGVVEAGPPAADFDPVAGRRTWRRTASTGRALWATTAAARWRAAAPILRARGKRQRKDDNCRKPLMHRLSRLP